MDRVFPLALVVGFPLGVGLLLWVLRRLIAALVPGERGRTFVHYAGLFSAVMSALLAVQAVFSGLATAESSTKLVDARWSWVDHGLGATDIRLVLDAVSAPFVLGASVAFVLVFLAGVTMPPSSDQGDGRSSVRRLASKIGALSFLHGASLVVLMADGAEELLIGWTLVVAATTMVLHAHASVPVVAQAVVARRLGPELVGLAAFGLGLAIWLAPAPATSFEALRLAAAPQAASVLRQAGPLGFVRVELGLALLLPAFALRAGLWPFAAAEPDERHLDATARTVLTTVVGLGLVTYLLLRLDVVFSLAPTTMAFVAVWGLVAGAMHVRRALRSTADGEVGLGLQRGRRLAASTAGLAAAMTFVTLGMGGFVEVTTFWLTAVPGLLAASMAVERLPLGGLGEAGTMTRRWAAIFVAGAALAFPTAGTLGLTRCVWAALSHQSSGSPGLNALAGLGLMVLALCGSIAWGRWLHRDLVKFSGPAASRDELGAMMVGPAMAVAASFGLAVYGLWAPTRLDTWLSTHATTVAAFSGAFDVGPRPGWSEMRMEPIVVTGLTVAVATLGLARWVVHPRVDGLWSAPSTRPRDRWLDAVWAAPSMIASGAWRAVSLVGQLLELGVERGALEDGARELTRGIQRPWDRILDRFERSPAPMGALGIFFGATLILGWVMFKPEVNTLGPNGVHGFGGLSPIMMTLKSAPDAARDPGAGESSPADEDIDPDAKAAPARDAVDGSEEVAP